MNLLEHVLGLEVAIRWWKWAYIFQQLRLTFEARVIVSCSGLLTQRNQ